MGKALIVMDANQRSGGFLDTSPVLDTFHQERLLRDFGLKGASVHSFDLVIHLGSDLSLAKGNNSPFIDAEVNLMIASVRHGLPVLGICFGAQMISYVHGGKVTRMAQPEIGWTNVFSTEKSAVFNNEWFQWHYDMFSLPEGAEKLAENLSCIQAFRIGRCFATQFHPEFNESVLENWLEIGGEEELISLGYSSTTLAEQTISRKSEARNQFDQLLEWFLKTV